MKESLYIFQFIFMPIAIFFITNWLGSYSSPYGYISLSLFVQKDQTPAYNILFRVLTPVIFITILSSIYYYLELDFFVDKIWLIPLLSQLFRFIYNTTLGRYTLINKRRELLIIALTTTISYILYIKFISIKKNLLPDPSNLTGELWIIIILYLYSILNNIDTGIERTEQRKHEYYERKFKYIKSKYHEIITKDNPSPILESLIYSIIIYEDFNRPYFARKIENLVFPHFSSSLGIMQVTTKRKISDKESVEIGTEKIKKFYYKEIAKLIQQATNADTDTIDKKYYSTYPAISETIKDYNKDNDYLNGITELHQILINKYYTQVEFIE